LFQASAPMRAALRYVFTGGWLCLLGACSGLSLQNLPAAPAQADSGDYSYVIGAGDGLSIVVWRNPELSMSVPVRPDGKMSAPLVEELMAQGKTPPQLARDIEKRLSTYVRDPVVTVLVSGFVGPYSEQIRVLGEAAKPQALPYKQKMTVLDVMIAVGGLTDFADGNRAILQRSAEGNKQYHSPEPVLIVHIQALRPTQTQSVCKSCCNS
jgi:polysaccharide biosynthesis/export protein